MREIEFRGKNCEDNWIYGQLTIIENDYYINYLDEVVGEFSDTRYIDYIGTEVSERTIGQYTGLKDKNNKKIFEGDLIKTYHGIGKVVWSGQFALFGYIMIEKENHEKEYDYRFTDIVLEEGVEIIGNIYDNPELLEDKQWQ